MPVKIRQLIGRSPTAWVKAWLRVLGPPFIALTAVVSCLGAAMVFRTRGCVDMRLWLISAVSLVLIHFGTSCLNDYFDFRSGTDNINQTPTPYSGGSRVLQEGALSPGALLAGGILWIFLGSLGGLYLASLRGRPIFALGAVGVFLAVGYVHPWVNLSKRGLGEAAVALGFGPLMLPGVCFVQTQSFDVGVVWTGALMGLLAATVLWINEIPDYEADKTTGKTNWVVRVGKKRASRVYVFLLGLIYLLTLGFIVSGVFPKTAWIVFATIFPAVRSGRLALKNYNEVEKLLPANALAIATTLTYGMLLSLAFLIA